MLDDYLKKINISQFELGAVNSVINCTYPFTESVKYRSQSYEDILVKIGDKNKALRCKENQLSVILIMKNGKKVLEKLSRLTCVLIEI